MRLGFLREDPAALGNLGPNDQRLPLFPGHADAIAPQDLDDHGVAVGAEVARILVSLPDFERHGTNPVQECGIIERLEHRRERRVAPLLPIETRIGKDLEPVLAVLAALVLDRPEAARAKVIAAHPRLDRLIEVVPERAPADTKADVHGLGVMHGVDANDFHRRVPDAEDPVFRVIGQPLSNGERHGRSDANHRLNRR